MTMHMHVDPESETVSVTTAFGWSDYHLSDERYTYTQGTHNLCALRGEDPAMSYSPADFRTRLELLDMVAPNV